MFTLFKTFSFSLISLGIIFLSITSRVTAAPIKIAAIFALSGKAKNSSSSVVLGTQLAVREINKTGGILGTKFELLLLDNQSTPIGSHLAAETAAGAEVTAIIGSVWSSHSLAIANVAEKHKIPMISPNSTIPSLTSIGDHIFRVCYDDNFQGRVAAEFAFKKQKAKTALVFVDIASDFSLNLATIFERTFRSFGGTTFMEIEYKSGQPDYQSQIRQALAYDADIVFFSGHDESGYLAGKLQEAGVTAIPIGNDSWDDKSFFALGGNKIKLGYFINHWTINPTDPLSISFVNKFKNEGEITAGMALAYDAVHVLAAAIKKAGSTDSSAIRSALHNLQGFRGVTGNISFDAEGNAKKQACMVEIREGKPYDLGCRISN